MIRNNIKRHSRVNIILIWIASILLLSFLAFGYVSYTGKIKFYNLVYNIRQIEINLFELTTFTKRMILEMDDTMKVRIIENKEKLNKHLTYLKTYTELAKKTNIGTLEDEVFYLFDIVNNLMLVEKDKKILMNNIREKIVFIDNLLKVSEKRILNSKKSDISVNLAFYKLDVLLSKLARELGLYLKTDNQDALSNINDFFIELEKQKKNFKMLTFTDEQKKLYTELMHYVEEKNMYIRKIINVHKKKTQTLKMMGKLTDKLDEHIGNDLNNILISEEKKIYNITFWSVIMFISLFIILVIFFILSRRFLFDLSSLVEDGFGQLLTATKQVSSNKEINNISFKEKKNEFHLIGQSMIEMQKALYKSNLSKEELENLLNTIGDFRYVINSDNMITFPSENLSSMLGYSSKDVLDASILGEYFDFSTCKALIKHNLIHDLDWHLVDKMQHIHNVTLSAILLSDASLFIIGKKQNIESVDSHENTILNGLVLIDGYGHVCDYNRIFSDSLSLPKEPKMEETLEILFSDYTLDKKIDIEMIKKMVECSEEIELTLTAKKSKEKNYLFINAYELFADSIKSPAYALVVQDITRMISKEEHALRLSHHDSLTGLLNRASLFDEITTMISTKKEEMTFGLLIISLSKFREVNDAFGHEVGDKLLVHMSQEIKTFFGEDKIISRLGGDEFSVLCTGNISLDEIIFQTAKLIEVLNSEVHINGHRIYPNVFIGISVYPEDGKNTKILLREANIALARAKDENKRFAFPNINESQDIIKNIELAQSLPKAFTNNEFELLYQPQIDVTTNTIVGYEALIRWHHSKFGDISPRVFIPIAEESEVINEIGIWVFTQVCQQILAWREMGNIPLKVAVNISAKHFESLSFVDDIIEIVSSYKVNPKWIQIEVTESQVQNIENTLSIHHRKLIDVGFTVAIDDFGTGFSSLVLLRKLYIDTIKVDKYFIDQIVEDSTLRDLLSGILFITEALKLKVVVEGVENEEQVKVLTDIGFRVFQGYYFSEPISATEVTQFKL